MTLKMYRSDPVSRTQPVYLIAYQGERMTLFNQGPIDGKSEVKVEKCHLVVELKLKMLNLQEVTFSISALPQGDTFEL